MLTIVRSRRTDAMVPQITTPDSRRRTTGCCPRQDHDLALARIASRTPPAGISARDSGHHRGGRGTRNDCDQQGRRCRRAGSRQRQPTPSRNRRMEVTHSPINSGRDRPCPCRNCTSFARPRSCRRRHRHWRCADANQRNGIISAAQFAHTVVGLGVQRFSGQAASFPGKSMSLHLRLSSVVWCD